MQPKHTEQEVLDAVKQYGSQRKAAEALGINIRSLERRLKRLALRGHSPEHDMVHMCPEGFEVKGTSTLYKADGSIAAQWVKTRSDDQRRLELMREAIDALCEDLPRAGKVKIKTETNEQLMAVYPIGDAHIGMRAWGEETQGSDWDMSIGERVQCEAMAALVDMAPAAERAVIINLGDWFHADNMEGITTRSGHHLDLDGRYAKMIRVGVKVMRQCIESALRKHKIVEVINVIGNHDDTGAMWLSVALTNTYENEPRVKVHDCPAAFMYVEHGKVLIGAHHGHTCKGERLPGVMATDQAKAWGRTEFRYWYLGHVHHQAVKEYSGCTVESFNTLSAKDAYAAWGGYRAQQNMKCIVHHKEYGEVARHTVCAEMFQ